MGSSDCVLYIPGVGDEPKEQERLPELWSRFDLEVEIQPIDWSDTDYVQRIEAIGNRIIELSTDKRVSLVGASGGGKAVLSLLLNYPDHIHRTVTISSKVKPYDLSSDAQKAYPNLVISSNILALELDEMADEGKHKTLCVCPHSDRVVSPDDALLKDANTLIVNAHGHIIGIRQALTLYAYKLANFIRTD
jgi:pimeloyl-ACP methyl ester carboxylesterase